MGKVKQLPPGCRAIKVTAFKSKCSDHRARVFCHRYCEDQSWDGNKHVCTQLAKLQATLASLPGIEAGGS